MTNASDAGTIADYYDTYSLRYEDERRAGYFAVINDLEFEKIAPAATGRDALEVGCGTGLILERVAGVAARAVGIDLSPGMLGVSARKGLRAVNTSVNTLPFADATFDVVYSCKVLAHVPDIRGALAEVARVLRPGGRAFLEFYNPRSLRGLGYRMRSRLDRSEPVFVRFDTLADVLTYLPKELAYRSTRGIRVFGPSGHFYRWPVVRTVFEWLDRRACDTALGRRYGGYLMIELVRAA